MNVLLLDPAGAFTDFAIKLQEHGHKVRQWQKPHLDGSASFIGKGLVPRVLNWQASMSWADITILSDNAYQMQFLEKYHKEGYPIFGACLETSYLELRRGFGQDIMEIAGLNIIPGKEFKTYAEGIAHLKANPKRYVSKPSGDADKSLSYVSQGPEDMLFMLERWASAGKNKMPFIMQEFVPGIEVAVGGWFGKGGFNKAICENFEFKKLMPGNFGVNTGEMGTVLKYVENSRLFDETLGKLEDFLSFQKYTGYVDLAFIVDEEGSPRPLEWTTRPGWPLFNIQAALHKGDPVEWMCDLLEGKDTLKVSNQVSVGNIVAVPDFPFTRSTGRDPKGFPIYGLDKVKKDSVHLCEVMTGKGPVCKDGKFSEESMLVTAGDYVLVTSGTADTIKEAAEKSMDVVKKIDIPSSKIVRNDIGKRLKEELPKLKSYGYCKEFKYE